MNITALIIAVVAIVIIAAILAAWGITYHKAVASRDAELIRMEADARTAEQLRLSETASHEKAVAELKEQHEKTIADLKAGHEKALADLKESQQKSLSELKEGQEKAIEAAKTALALENEKALKAREEALKKDAAETMKVITGGLDKDIKDMKTAFEAQKESHLKESTDIKAQFAQTVKHLREQTESIGNTAEDLAKALKGQSKMQGIFGETILENILKAEGLREGHDYSAEFWLRDRKGNRIVNEESGKKMRPDFALHFPDDTEVLLDSKVSLTALADYFAAETDAERADAAARNLESVQSHIKELNSKEYQKYVEGKKTLDYVIMFIPNYAAYQLAKMEDKDIFAKAFKQNVLITTEETLIPFLRLIRTAWIQKEQMENIGEIVSAAQMMVDRVALFCEENAKLENDLSSVLDKFRKNSARLVDSDKSIVKAALKAVNHGIKAPTNHLLPQTLPGED